jgi:hypothetical protein
VPSRALEKDGVQARETTGARKVELSSLLLSLFKISEIVCLLEMALLDSLF